MVKGTFKYLAATFSENESRYCEDTYAGFFMEQGWRRSWSRGRRGRPTAWAAWEAGFQVVVDGIGAWNAALGCLLYALVERQIVHIDVREGEGDRVFDCFADGLQFRGERNEIRDERPVDCHLGHVHESRNEVGPLGHIDLALFVKCQRLVADFRQGLALFGSEVDGDIRKFRFEGGDCGCDGCLFGRR